MVEILKQPPYSPLPIEKQIVIIYAGAKGYLDDIAVSQITRFEAELYPFIEDKYPDIFTAIAEKKALDESIESELKRALEDFKMSFFN